MTDLTGRELDAAEAALLDVYRRLKDLADRDDLPPCAAANVRHALGHAWNAVNDLGLVYEHLLDRGV